MPIKAVVFDLYETLIYMSKTFKCYARLYEMLGLSTEERIQSRLMVRLENFTSFADLAQRLRPGSTVDCRELERDSALEVASAMLYPETISVLEQLKASGYKIGLISNVTTPYVQPVINLGLVRYFDEAIYSCEEGLVKPDPLIYQLMIGKLGLDPSQIIMTGDQVAKDVLPARAVGMNAVHLDRTGISSPGIPSLDGIFQFL